MKKVRVILSPEAEEVYKHLTKEATHQKYQFFPSHMITHYI